MNGYPVLKGASYTLAITPDMVIHNGTTQTTEMIVTPEPFKKFRGCSFLYPEPGIYRKCKAG